MCFLDPTSELPAWGLPKVARPAKKVASLSKKVAGLATFHNKHRENTPKAHRNTRLRDMKTIKSVGK